MKFSESEIAQMRQRPPSVTSKISITLPCKDWKDLINFVNGDLANMAEDDPNRKQMDRILNQIRRDIA